VNEETEEEVEECFEEENQDGSKRDKFIAGCGQIAFSRRLK
jgi:hypothetical protein